MPSEYKHTVISPISKNKPSLDPTFFLWPPLCFLFPLQEKGLLRSVAKFSYLQFFSFIFLKPVQSDIWTYCLTKTSLNQGQKWLPCYTLRFKFSFYLIYQQYFMQRASLFLKHFLTWLSWCHNCSYLPGLLILICLFVLTPLPSNISIPDKAKF